MLYNQHNHVTDANHVKEMQMMLIFTNVVNKLELFIHYNLHHKLTF
jgi:hypothetical protein